jgi:hypothetical protein
MPSPPKPANASRGGRVRGRGRGRGSTRHSGSEDTTVETAPPQEPTKAIDIAGRNDRHVSRPSADFGNLAPLRNTPLKHYAGPTFHSSPAASALPMPKFAQKSTASPAQPLSSSLPSFMPSFPAVASPETPEKAPVVTGTPTRTPQSFEEFLAQPSPTARLSRSSQPQPGTAAETNSPNLLNRFFEADKAQKALRMRELMARTTEQAEQVSLEDRSAAPQLIPIQTMPMADSRMAVPQPPSANDMYRGNYTNGTPPPSEPRQRQQHQFRGPPKTTSTPPVRPPQPAHGHWANIYGGKTNNNHSRSLSSGEGALSAAPAQGFVLRPSVPEHGEARSAGNTPGPTSPFSANTNLYPGGPIPFQRPLFTPAMPHQHSAPFGADPRWATSSAPPPPLAHGWPPGQPGQ